ncbi:unnamed protein product [Mycena citricolor]|uniref:NmrA-like domain-containing protein n=1 Tax=Mycena citricolor TaxID=2018698 RepID=A0AAD2H063_9AGAR|nr:unnamed protein product [Mycena citricolor]
MAPTKILFTGATGYIGGTILSRFLAEPDASSRFAFTVIVRDPKKAEKFKQFGVTPVVGSHSDETLVEELASQADVVIATADCDDLVAAKATLAGLKKRAQANGTPPIFINTSGTGEICDNARGLFAEPSVYDDTNATQMASIPPEAMHRNVDNAILAADVSQPGGFVKTYIILPGTVWGLAKTPLVAAGIQNDHSIQIPSQIQAAIDRKRAGMVGEGKNIWPNVEVHDLAELFYIVYDKATSGADLGHGYEGFFFGASDDHTLLEVAKEIGKALVATGRSDNPEPTSFTKEELDKYFQGSEYLGSNSRCKANHSFAIGWKPAKKTADMLADIPDEIESLIKSGRSIQLR